jgi:hypothetical protein
LTLDIEEYLDSMYPKEGAATASKKVSTLPVVLKEGIKEQKKDKIVPVLN